MASARHAGSLLARLVQSAVRSGAVGSGVSGLGSWQANLTSLRGMATAAAPGPVLAACVLERLPVVAPPDPDWEVEYHNWKEERARRYRKAYGGEFADVKKAADAEAVEEDFGSYQAEIEAAENSDPRSPWRRLDQRIFMLVKQKGGDGGWTFPSTPHQAGETVRQAAERALAAALAPGPKVYFVGNSPAGHQPLQGGGGTLFFHRAQLVRGPHSALALAGGGQYVEYALAAKDELGQYVQDAALLALLQDML